jgi:predicted transcriptional regulator
MKESTARTILARLEEKGYVRHRVEGRTNIYSGLEPQANVAATAVRRIIDRLYGGSVEELLVGMVDSEVIDRQELAALARKIARSKARKGE